MLLIMSQHWRSLALRGAIAILFGLAAFVWPLATALAFVILLATFAFVEGIFALVGAFGWGRAGRQRLTLVVMGLLGLAVGAASILWPGITALTIVLIVAYWAIITGVLQIFVAVEIRTLIDNEWLLVLSGLISIVFGILLIWRPGAGIITLTWLFGIYAIVYGIIMLGLGFRLKSLVGRTAKVA